jgi:hypothetical protein
MHQLQHAQFKMKPLLLPVSEFIKCAKHDLEKPRQLFLRKLARHAPHASPFV